jgi:hypothetical protein
VSARDNSTLSVSSGTFSGGVSGNANAEVYVTGGILGGGIVSILGNPLIQIDGGTFHDANLTAGVTNMTGGTISDSVTVSAGDWEPDDSRFNFEGGEIGSLSISNQTSSAGAVGSIVISGGIVLGDVSLWDDVSLVMEHGVIAGKIVGARSSSSVIKGGELGENMILLDNADITIIGFGFNPPLGSVSEIQGQLTGFPSDGTPLNANFGLASSATITLIPEPSTALLMGLGLVGIAAARRRT